MSRNRQRSSRSSALSHWTAPGRVNDPAKDNRKMRTHATEEVFQPFGAANNRCVLLTNRKRTKTKVFTEIENIQVKDASIENVDAFITHFFHILSYVTMEDEQILVKLKQKLQRERRKTTRGCRHAFRHMSRGNI